LAAASVSAQVESICDPCVDAPLYDTLRVPGAQVPSGFRQPGEIQSVYPEARFRLGERTLTLLNSRRLSEIGETDDTDAADVADAVSEASEADDASNPDGKPEARADAATATSTVVDE
jgi:hypothetical protein